MQKIIKWNFKLHKYQDAEIDDRCSMYEDDMEAIVRCPNCNKDVAFGETYTSRQYHNDIGFGYAICEECHRKELRKIEKYKGR